MKLYLNTSSNEKTIVALDGLESIKDSKTQHSQVVIPMIENLLSKKNKNINDVTEIEVFEGPGSFTGLRVGIAIANALGFALKIPVNSKMPSKLQFIEPIYK